MKAQINKNQNVAEVFIAEGCHIMEWSNSDNDPQVSIAKARVEVGVTTQWHRLRGISERYVILSGQGSVEVAHLEPRDVIEGDTVLIPANNKQRISNTGNTDLVFLAICSPRFRPEYYESL